MRTVSFLGNTFAAGAAAAMLAGCASAVPSSAAAVPAVQARHPLNKASHAVAFLSDFNNDVIDIIDNQGNVTTLPATGPEGLAVDAKHNLYVVNAAYSDVMIFAPPYNGSPKVLANAGVMPIGVAVDRKGDVAVASVGTFSTGVGAVVFYGKGALKPTNIVDANREFAGDYYCAFDANGNLYVTSKNGSGPFEAGEIVGGITGTAVTPLTTKNLVQYPSGIAVTGDGKIAILDQSQKGSTATIYTYNPPKGHSFGNPIATTELAGANDAVAFAFTDRGRQVFSGDTYYTVGRVKSNHQTPMGQAQWFDYPSGGQVNDIGLGYGSVIVGAAVTR